MKGLLLNYEYGMWDAVLKRLKTNTRRCHKSLVKVNENPDNYEFIGFDERKDGLFARFSPKNGGAIVNCRARYAKNEVTFLQEPTMNLKGTVTDEDMIFYLYRDDQGQSDMDSFKQVIETGLKKGAKWGNKMFMGEIEARYFVKIKRIEVERLRDISEYDCLAEGIQKNTAGYFFTQDGRKVLHDTAQKAYFRLYKIINKESAENPWVFSYHFERCGK